MLSTTATLVLPSPTPISYSASLGPEMYRPEKPFVGQLYQFSRLSPLHILTTDVVP